MTTDAQPLHWGWLALTAFGICAIEVAKSASADIFDYRSDTDRALTAPHRSPFSGGKRNQVVQTGLRRASYLFAVLVAASLL